MLVEGGGRRVARVFFSPEGRKTGSESAEESTETSSSA